MKHIRTLSFAFLFLSAGLLAAGFAGGGQIVWIIPLFFIAILWSLGLWKNWRWSSTIGLMSVTGLAAYSLVTDIPLFWAVSSLIFALMTWSSAYFYLRVGTLENIDDPGQHAKNFLLRLLYLILISTLIVILAASLTLTLSFGKALALSFGLVLAMIFVMRAIRREERLQEQADEEENESSG